MHAKIKAGTILAGRFQVECALSHDAAGTFWDAFDHTSDEPATVREIAPEVGLGTREVDEIGATLQQVFEWSVPGAVVPYALIAEGRRVFAVSSPIHGRPLSALRLERPSRWLDVSEIAPIAAQIARIMDAAHNRRLVHGGLRPGNIFVDDDGRVTIADFGIAGAISSCAIRNGSPAIRAALEPFSSRTLLKGQGPYRTDDVYAFGAVLYEALTGTFPLAPQKPRFWSKSRAPRAPALLNERRNVSASGKLAKRIPSSWEQVILSCLDRDGFARPQSFGKIIPMLVSTDSARQEASPAKAEPFQQVDTSSRPGSRPAPAVHTPPQEIKAERLEAAEEEPIGKQPQTRAVESPRPAVAVASGSQNAPKQHARGPGSTWNDALNTEFWGGDPLAKTMRQPPRGNRSSPQKPRRPAVKFETASTGSGASKVLLRILIAVLSIGMLGAAAYFAALERKRWLNDSTTSQAASDETPDAPAAAPTAPAASTPDPQPAPSAPAVAAPKPQATGSLVVLTVPIGASVKIDDGEPQAGPVMIDELAAGRHRITVDAEGFSTRRREVEIFARQTTNINITLERATGTASLTSTSPGLAFTVSNSSDGRSLVSGVTPRDLNLPTGKYEVVFTPPEGEHITRTFTISEQANAVVAVDYTPPPPKEAPPPAEPIAERASPPPEEPPVAQAQATPTPPPVEPEAPPPAAAPAPMAGSETELPKTASDASAPAEETAPATEPEPESVSEITSEPGLESLFEPKLIPELEPKPELNSEQTSEPVVASDQPVEPSAENARPDPSDANAVPDSTSAEDLAAAVASAAIAAAPKPAPPPVGVGGPPLDMSPPTSPPMGRPKVIEEVPSQPEPAPAPVDDPSPKSAVAKQAPVESKPSDSNPPPPALGNGVKEPPPDEAVRLYALSEVDTKPQLLEREEPKPPRRFRRKDGSGIVRIEVIIDREGFISSARVGETTDDRLAQSCLEAIHYWRFSPARKDGQRVAVRATLPFVFK